MGYPSPDVTGTAQFVFPDPPQNPAENMLNPAQDMDINGENLAALPVNGDANPAVGPDNVSVTSLCGQILRALGDDHMSKTCGYHLRCMGDEYFFQYALQRILSQNPSLILHIANQNQRH